MYVYLYTCAHILFFLRSHIRTDVLYISTYTLICICLWRETDGAITLYCTNVVSMLLSSPSYEAFAVVAAPPALPATRPSEGVVRRRSFRVSFNIVENLTLHHLRSLHDNSSFQAAFQIPETVPPEPLGLARSLQKT